MKKYLFIFMIINIFFITNVNAVANSDIVNQTYISLSYSGLNNQRQNCSASGINGLNCEVKLELPTGTTNIDLNSYNVIMITPFIQINQTETHLTGSSVSYTNNDEIYYLSFRSMIEFYDGPTSYCDMTDSTMICRLNGSNIKGVYIQIINPYVQISAGSHDSINLSGFIGTNAVIGNYAGLSDIFQQNQNQHQEIMQNDPTNFNNGIESITGNTQLPNNSGLFDVLSSLSSFVGNLSASGSCSPISIPIPFTTQNLRLPCMTTEVYAPNFPELLAIWQLIVRGLVYYYIIVNMLKLLKDTIDPFSMKLEVLDL